MADFGIKPPMGSDGGIVEADETHVSRKPGMKAKPSCQHKDPVFSLVKHGDDGQPQRLPEGHGGLCVTRDRQPPTMWNTFRTTQGRGMSVGKYRGS